MLRFTSPFSWCCVFQSLFMYLFTFVFPNKASLDISVPVSLSSQARVTPGQWFSTLPTQWRTVRKILSPGSYIQDSDFIGLGYFYILVIEKKENKQRYRLENIG